MTTYAKWTENNDYEGEVWHFYIPIEGNEAALTQLDELIKTIEDEAGNTPFELDKTPLSEFEVHVLVKHSESGYMPQHNRLAGTLVLPEDIPEDIADRMDLFYKGRIENWMEE